MMTARKRLIGTWVGTRLSLAIAISITNRIVTMRTRIFTSHDNHTRSLRSVGILKTVSSRPLPVLRSAEPPVVEDVATPALFCRDGHGSVFAPGRYTSAPEQNHLY